MQCHMWKESSMPECLVWHMLAPDVQCEACILYYDTMSFGTKLAGILKGPWFGRTETPDVIGIRSDFDPDARLG